MRVAKQKDGNKFPVLSLYIAKIVRVAKLGVKHFTLPRRLYIAKIVRVAKLIAFWQSLAVCLYIAKIVRVAKLII